jgi:hypothetical protein
MKAEDYLALARRDHKRAQPEAALQRAIVTHLRTYRRKRWLIWATPNAGKRDPRYGAELKRQGLTAGVGDISLVRPDGTYHELELKAARGRLSDLQKARAIEVEAAGGKWAVAHSLDEALAILTDWGALRLQPSRRANDGIDPGAAGAVGSDDEARAQTDRSAPEPVAAIADRRHWRQSPSSPWRQT